MHKVRKSYLKSKGIFEVNMLIYIDQSNIITRFYYC